MSRKGFRLLHTADLHLDTPNSHHALEKLVAFARSDGIDLVVIAGDLFDSNYVNGDSLEFALEKLRSFSVPLLILPGNHDCLVEGSIYRRAGLISADQAIRVFTEPEGQTFRLPELNLSVWGKPLCTYSGGMHPLADVPARGPERWHIAVAHGQIIEDVSTVRCSFTSGSGCSFPITMDEVVSCERDYVALGHWPMACRVVEGATTAYYCGAAAEMGTFLTVDFAEGQSVRVTTHHV